MDVSSYTAFHLRLQLLESIIGNPTTTVSGPSLFNDLAEQMDAVSLDADSEKEEDGCGKDIAQRTGDLAQNLRNAVLESGHESLRRLVDEYDSLAEILFPYNAPPSQDNASDTSISDKHRRAPSTNPPAIKPSDLIPLETKRELVLGAVADIKDAEKMLREIQLLVERGVDGSGDLAAYEPLQERLAALETTQAIRLASQRKLQEEVIDIVGRYDHYVTSMSRMFVDIHMQVTEMEEQVARLEREKKEREAMTY